MSAAGPLRVALAGAGMISWHHLSAWKTLGAEIDLVAVCDPVRGNAESRAAEFGIARVYDDPEAMFAAERIDALDVASPRETHAAWVDAASARGIDVLCQKPMTPTLAESEALVQRVDGKIRMMVHENWRFRPWFRELKRWIDAGALGEIVLGRLSEISSGILPNEKGERPALVRQPFMAHEKRLMIAEVLIHHLDTMRYLCGPLRVIGARTGNSVEIVAGESLAAIFLENAAGAPIDVTGTMAAPGFSPRAPDRLELVGTRASAVLEDNELRLLGPKPEMRRFDLAEGYQASFNGVIAHFVKCLRTGAAFETGPSDNLETLRLVEHAYRAAAAATPYR